jgi:hypothetical protein
MSVFNYALLFLHFLGLAMGLSVPFGNMVMMGLIEKASPAEKPVLGRFPPAISRIGKVGLALLWITGVAMAFTRWNGIASMPWTFHVKLAAVVLLTLLVGYVTMLEGRVRGGDMAAAARMRRVGMFTFPCALIAILFAVITFD